MFLRAVVPSPHLALPTLLTPAQFTVAKDAIAAAQNDYALKKTDFTEVLQSVIESPAPKLQREQRRALDNITMQYRGELLKLENSDPVQRMQIHQAIMAAGFYSRALNFQQMPNEQQRFVVHHYNHDLRIDSKICIAMDKIFITEKPDYPRGDQLVSEVLLLERHLFGANRLFAVNGKQNMMLAVPFMEIKTAEHMQRILDHPIVKRDGNFTSQLVDLAGSEQFWQQETLKCGPEEGLPFYTMRTYMSADDRTDQYQTKYHKVRILTRRERVTNFLLRAWVIWLSLWGMFWAVDEEIITFAALIYGKIKTMRNLEKIAEDAGGSKIYVAHKPNFYTYKESFTYY